MADQTETKFIQVLFTFHTLIIKITQRGEQLQFW